MRFAAFVTVSAVALALAGCGDRTEPDAQATSSADAAGAGMGAGAATPAAGPGQTFADTAASSDMFEIESSKMAADRASSAKVKTFAETMVKHHTESSAKLKTAASTATPAVTPNPQLTIKQQQSIGVLRAKTGAEFDKAYAAAQVEAHQMTLDALKAYSASGDVPSLKAHATETVPVVTAHLNMAKGL